MIKPQIPKGFRDFLPKSMNVRNEIIKRMTEKFEKFGFQPLDTPCLEYAETLEGKYGEEGDRLIYRFQDRGGRNVALRYDLTIPLSRVVAMYSDLPKPFKRYQIAPVWRADKPQKGRFREFYQCDVDIIGSSSPYAEGELLVLTYEVLQALGFDDFEMRINSRKILNAFAKKIGWTDDSTAPFLRCLDKIDKAGWSAVFSEMKEKITLTVRQEEIIKETFHSDDDSFKSVADLVKDEPQGREGLDELEKIIQTLRAYDIPQQFYKLDMTLARGLDYYTGPIFETVVKEPSIGSITGGGRYDDLIGLFSKQSIPATGTSFGLERIVTVIEELGLSCRDGSKKNVYITLFDAELMTGNMKIAGMLRDAGIAAEIHYQPDKLKKQLSYAAGRGFAVVLIRGTDEARDNAVTVRCMADGTQECVPLERLVETVTNKIERDGV